MYCFCVKQSNIRFNLILQRRSFKSHLHPEYKYDPRFSATCVILVSTLLIQGESKIEYFGSRKTGSEFLQLKHT